MQSLNRLTDEPPASRSLNDLMTIQGGGDSSSSSGSDDEGGDEDPEDS